ncbi:holo-ACP synthase [Leptospira langatensis]|uniref:Holo-[acyl-carrier-protein] synthase n=1 Tax=Leptospira langatensis TaxID=2484983 RepID=A0A5F1ZTN6_9LEPT|nr:holo-ACP synthase [Leptospira langatensis]TGK02852.1 holo-ACP synthase [Leptospira langatensis]TGL41606.1 holo-ACP synthase [Leptospira langatensis]
MKTQIESLFASFGSSSKPTASIGVDLTFIPEFEESLQDKGTFFFAKTFSEWERSRASSKPANQRAAFFAGRYAAKEAVIKALDGYRLFQTPEIRVNYSEIEIRNDDFGRPYLRFYGTFLEYMEDLKPDSIRVSISHTGDYAFSEVLLVL